jgi:hypothetical protein
VFSKPPAEDFVPINSDVHVTDCLGWVEYKGSDINEQYKKVRVSDQESKMDD